VSPMNLTGQVALVTGGSRGIGLVIAHALGQAGAKVAIAARSTRELDVAHWALSSKGIVVMDRSVDVTRRAAVETLVSKIHERWGSVDVLVNCAGVIGALGRLDEVDPVEWRHTFEVNVFGTMHACAAVLPGMRARRRGKIVNITGGGVGGSRVTGGWSAYVASKAAVAQLTEALAKEVQDDGVQVNAVAPGAIVTQMTAEIVAAGPDKIGRDLYERTLKERESGGESPQRAAQMVVWLASAASGDLTGKVLSARWDKVESIDVRAANASSLYCLRRIDDVTFAPKEGT